MKDTKHIRFSFLRLGHALGVNFGALGCSGGGGSFIFSKHGHSAYQIDGNDEQNRIQVKCFTMGSNW